MYDVMCDMCVMCVMCDMCDMCVMCDMCDTTQISIIICIRPHTAKSVITAFAEIPHHPLSTLLPFPAFLQLPSLLPLA